MGLRVRHLARHLSVAVAAVLLLSASIPGPAGAQQAGQGSLTVRGFLPMPEDALGSVKLVGIDNEARTLYLTYYSGGTHLVAYDLEPRVPEILRDEVIIGNDTVDPQGVRPGSDSWFRGNAALAPDRQLVFQMERFSPTAAKAADPASAVHVWSLADFDLAESWLLAERGLAGFVPQGLTYSSDDGRVYLVGEFTGIPLLGDGILRASSVVSPATPLPAVAALDADSGDLAWVRPLPRCRTVLSTGANGLRAMVARSSVDDSLYVVCQPGGALEAQYPGQPVLVRVHAGGDAEAVDAVGFPVDYIPVPGNYSPQDGVATFSRAADRVFLNSLSQNTPGTFVFDGQRSAWVGHVTAPSHAYKRLGVDEDSGRFYLASGGRVVVTDGSATPPPQALPQELTTDDGVTLGPNSRIMADPGSNRFFVEVESEDDRYNEQIAVVDDTAATIDPLPPPDHDAETADVPEGPDTSVNYTVVSSGFGALGRLVGGAGNVGSYGLIGGQIDPFSTLNATLENVGQEAEEPVVVSQGDRTVVAADVPSMELAAFGATGDAQALSTDQGTSGELNESGNFAAEQGAPGQVPPKEDDEEMQADEEGSTVPVTDAATSPYRKVECSDNGFDDDATDRSDGDDVDAGDLEGTGAGTGHARVVCDLAGQQSTATATWRAGPAADRAAGPAVAAAGFDTRLSRDPEEGGAGTETTAVASGIELPVPEVGTLHIGEVRATSVTDAAGRPGTTKATWTRTLSGVVVRDADGVQLFPPKDGAGSDAGSCATVVSVHGGGDEQRQEADNCGLLVDALNQLLQPRVAVTLPSPDLDATPKGAYAQVRQTDDDFHHERTVLGDSSRAVPALQLVVVNDGIEKSRLLLHLAAIDTSVIYKIDPCLFCSFDGGTDPDPAPVPTTEAPSPTPATTATGQPAVGTAAAPPPPTSLPVQQPEGQSIDLAAAQPSTSEPEVAPQQALSLPGRIGAGLQLLTRDPVQALLVGGVWLLFAGALTTLLRRTRLRQLVSS